MFVHGLIHFAHTAPVKASETQKLKANNKINKAQLHLVLIALPSGFSWLGRDTWRFDTLSVMTPILMPFWLKIGCLQFHFVMPAILTSELSSWRLGARRWRCESRGGICALALARVLSREEGWSRSRQGCYRHQPVVLSALYQSCDAEHRVCDKCFRQGGRMDTSAMKPQKAPRRRTWSRPMGLEPKTKAQSSQCRRPCQAGPHPQHVCAAMNPGPSHDW